MVLNGIFMSLFCICFLILIIDVIDCGFIFCMYFLYFVHFYFLCIFVYIYMNILYLCFGDGLGVGGGCKPVVAARVGCGWVWFEECCELLCGWRFPL